MLPLSVEVVDDDDGQMMEAVAMMVVVTTAILLLLSVVSRSIDCSKKKACWHLKTAWRCVVRKCDKYKTRNALNRALMPIFDKENQAMDHNSYSRYDPDHSQKLHHSYGNDCLSKYPVSQIRVVDLHGSGRVGPRQNVWLS